MTTHLLDNFTRRPRLWGLLLVLGLSVSGLWNVASRAAELPPLDEAAVEIASRTPQPATGFQEGTTQALRAWESSQSARTPEDWHRVAQHWTQAVAAMQSVPLDNPQRAFAQKKVSEYLQSARYALEQAAESGNRLPYPTFNSLVFDEQLALYRAYVATLGAPDVLVVGSSRALQGVDPKRLQFELSQRSLSDVTVFNLGVNGATAQVVNLLLRQVLRPEELPAVLVWADGSRAFNSGRPDRTFERVRASPGYQQVQAGNREFANRPVSLSRTDIDANGFHIVRDRFNPSTYFQQYPFVPGDYDRDYANFNLGGVQGDALNSLVQWTQSRDIPLILVNLPLTNDYLDPTRRRYEQQFSQFLQQQATKPAVWVRDLSALLRDRPSLFADPSHLNRDGAAAVAQRLARDNQLPWGTR